QVGAQLVGGGPEFLFEVVEELLFDGLHGFFPDEFGWAGVACPIACGVCSHLAARPLPVGVISPSAFMARKTTRTMSRLMPGQASSISEIENGRFRLRISARTR